MVDDGFIKSAKLKLVERIQELTDDLAEEPSANNHMHSLINGERDGLIWVLSEIFGLEWDNG